MSKNGDQKTTEKTRGTLEDIVMHYIPELPSHKTYFPTVKFTNEDVLISQRLINVFHACIQEESKLQNKPVSGLWEMIRNEFQVEFIRTLENKDSESLAKILCQAFRDPISWGLGAGATVYEAARNNGQRFATLCADKLISLAEYLAILPVENPEQGRWGESIYSDLADLTKRISKQLKINIFTPQVCAPFGLKVEKGLIFPRSVEHLYVAIRVFELLKNSRGRSVLEIGAGYGGVAYYLNQFGIKNYTIIDLPVVNVLQGYYLIKSLPKEIDVCLYGEKSTDHSIRILPYFSINEFQNDSFNVTLNQDSFPEIPEDTVIDYLKKIRLITSHFFYSINQESQGLTTDPNKSQLFVPEIIERIDGFNRISRNLYWLRKGYVEEIYAVTF